MNQSLRALLLFPLVVILAVRATAGEPGRIIYTFQGGAQGRYPYSAPVLDAAGNLYGTAFDASYSEIVFELSKGGVYQVLYDFSGGLQGAGGLVFDKAGNLYGTIDNGGSYNDGMVFELTRNSNGSWSESVLYSFGSYFQDGSHPISSVTFDAAGNLYGTTDSGGAHGQGTVFELTPNLGGSWTESLLYSFRGTPDGGYPAGPLTIDGAGNLYGTTVTGGDMFLVQCELNQFNGCGIVFELTPQTGGGWTESVLYNFQGYLYADGSWPASRLVFDSAGSLYGTTQLGGYCEFCGVLFKLSPSQNGVWTEKVLRRLKGSNGSMAIPSVVFDPSGNLYWAATEGGQYNSGAVFQLRPGPGGNWRTGGSYSFTGGSDGGYPSGLVFDAGGRLYGFNYYGGDASGMAGNGVVFEAKP